MKKKLEPPKPSIGDHLHTGVRVALAAVPDMNVPDLGSIPVGSVTLELFNATIQPPIQKRQQAWMEAIAQKLFELETNGSIKIEDLKHNELFNSVLIEATVVAIKTHSQQKRELLKNAIIHSALGITVDDDSAVLFVRYVDELTPTHVLLLRQLHLHPEPLKTINGYEELYKLFAEAVDGTVSKDAFKFFCEDLAARGLIRLSQDIYDFTDIYQAGAFVTAETDDSLPRIRVTDLGHNFLAFIMAEN
jgi:hypothetical protein